MASGIGALQPEVVSERRVEVDLTALSDGNMSRKFQLWYSSLVFLSLAMSDDQDIHQVIQQSEEEDQYEIYETPRTIAVSRRGGARFYTWRRAHSRGRTGFSYPNRAVHMLESERDGYYQEFQRSREFRLEAIRYHDLSVQHQIDRDIAREQASAYEAQAAARANRIAELEADLVSMTLDRDSAMEKHQHYMSRIRSRLHDAYRLTTEQATEEMVRQGWSDQSEGLAPMDAAGGDEEGSTGEEDPAEDRQIELVAVSSDTRGTGEP